MSSSGDGIDSFLQAVAAGLPGPARSRRPIPDELYHGLREAADANERAGLEPGRAAELALAHFGDPPRLARSFSPELALSRARRTALALFGAGSVVATLWIAAARSRGTTAPGGLFDSPTDHIAAAVLIIAAVACGLWTLATTRCATRWLDLRPDASLLGATAIGALTLIGDLAALGLLTARLAGFPGTLHQLALVAAIIASCPGIFIAALATRSCLAASRAA